MCGILVTRTKDKLGLIDHRGYEGRYEVTEGGLYIEHRCLPIQTVAGDNWSQPIHLDNGDILLYNGEIFNYPETFENDVHYLKELFTNLPLTGAVRESNLWDGFWAIVIVKSNGDIFAFTDPLGKKQLYYNGLGEICSEIYPLMRGPIIEPDQLYRSQVLKFGYHIGERTPWESVKRVLPNLVIKFDGVNWRYTNHSPFIWGSHIPRGGLKPLMLESVRARDCMSKQRVGLLLSGGLDSSIIAACCAELGLDIPMYYIDNEEAEFAHKMANTLGYKLTELPKIRNISHEDLKYNETPVDLGSVFPQHSLMAACKERVILTGDGADELFGGYSRAKEYDSQHSDIFDELTYYHLPRLDRASMRYTIELRNPFLSHDVVRYALTVPRRMRTSKQILKQEFKDMVPKEILDRPKLALKSESVKKDQMEHRKLMDQIFYKDIDWSKPKE